MTTLRRAAIANAMILSAILAGCQRESSALLAKGGAPASWRSVEDGWGGLAAGQPKIARDSVTLPLRLGVHETKRVDSAICVTALFAEVKGGRIVVHLHRGLCGSGSVVPYPHAANFPRPAAGTYRVVYSDLFAGYPQIGEVRIP